MKRFLLLGALMASPATAGDWFLHEYGELRAYFGDWLAACDEAGAGQCRAVQSGKDAGSDAYFDYRLRLFRIDHSPDWAVEVMDRNLPASDITELVFAFDGEAIAIPAGAWEVGDIMSPVASDTVTIRNPDLARDLVTRMKPASRVTVTYAPAGTGDGMATFSLRGVTAAINAVDARVLARQE